VLLADLDLKFRNGRFHAVARPKHIYHCGCAENSLELDENLWPKIVSSKDALDVLPVGKLSPGFRN